MTATPRIAINGLGRIGRLLLRLLWEHPEVHVVAVNDAAPVETLAYLLKYDTAQRTWDKIVAAEDKMLIIDGQSIPCSNITQIEQLPWNVIQPDIVIDCTGYSRNRAIAQKHIDRGAQKVIISAPADEQVKTIVLGVNDDLLDATDTILSNASCTTNCLAPMAKVMQDHFGIQYAIMNTIHAYTGDQRLQDGVHGNDLRRARAAAQNIVPTTSNATSTLEWVLPSMKGKLIGGAVRVPVVVGSLTELYCHTERQADTATINNAFKAASEIQFKGLLGYTEDPVVSSDIIHSPLSCLFDATLTVQVGDLVKIVGWYDNEYGYANRLSELVRKVATLV